MVRVFIRATLQTNQVQGLRGFVAAVRGLREGMCEMRLGVKLMLCLSFFCLSDACQVSLPDLIACVVRRSRYAAYANKKKTQTDKKSVC